MTASDEKIRSFRHVRTWVKRDLVQRGAIAPDGRITIAILLRDPVNLFMLLLRLKEWTTNGRAPVLVRLAIAVLFRRQSIKLGFSIPPNVFGPGLAIVHYGPIVVNGNARVGTNCRVHVCVNIGGTGALMSPETAVDLAPRIGNNVYISPGVKIYGPIRIADGIAIGANAVVNRTFDEAGTTIAGVPARVTSHKGSSGMIVEVSGEPFI